MNRLIRAELLKLRTTRMVYCLAAATLVSVVVGVAGGIVGAGKNGNPLLDTAEGVANVVSAEQGTVFALVLGILLMAGEFRYNTVTSTFLVTPDRGRVVAAKLAAAATVGLALAVIATVVDLAIALPWLAAKHVPSSLVGDQLGPVVLGTLVVIALYGVLGVGVGALLRNQVAAVAVALGWMLVVEQLVVALLPHVGRWLPLGAAGALIRDDGDLLPMWGGAVLFAAYGLTFAVAGTRFVLRRDVS